MEHHADIEADIFIRFRDVIRKRKLQAVAAVRPGDLRTHSITPLKVIVGGADRISLAVHLKAFILIQLIDFRIRLGDRKVNEELNNFIIAEPLICQRFKILVSFHSGQAGSLSHQIRNRSGFLRGL